ncbi:hypothetical protein TREES_T100012756 [Tupaia chinensis]|uniref:Uncharacterized protein n=1 Tax=Tupaia chinensis TaxID=246437 RepID=L8XZS6_TUPCH|nr:hypothetical protein TREES_T100012756 [Tupaia chinensis]
MKNSGQEVSFMIWTGPLSALTGSSYMQILTRAAALKPSEPNLVP